MGQFKPGESGNPAGRPVGSKSKNTLRDWVFTVLEEQLTIKKINADLKQLEPKDRIQALLKLLEYALPRLRSIEELKDLNQDKDPLDLSNLTLDERKEYLRLIRKCQNPVEEAPNSGSGRTDSKGARNINQ